MLKKYRALLWEQSRVAGAVVSAVYALVLITQLLLQMLHPGNAFLEMLRAGLLRLVFGMDADNIQGYNLILDDVFGMSVGFGAFMAIVVAFAICLRFDASGNLTSLFDERLLRLPVGTAALTLTLLWTRMLALSGLCIAQWLTIAVLFGGFSDWRVWMVPIEVYLVVQTLTWSAGRIRGKSYLFILAGLGLLLCFRMADERFLYGNWIPLPHLVRDWLHRSVLSLPFAIASPKAFAATFGVCTAISWWSVSLCRRDGRVGPPELNEVAARRLGRWEATSFATANDAVAWYVWRTAAWPMPLLTAAYSLAMLTVFAIFARHTGDLWLPLIPGPYFALAMAAITSDFAASFGKRRGDSFCLRAPLSCADMAHARFCANAKGITISFGLALAWSVLGMSLTMRPLLGIVEEIVHAGLFTRCETFVLFASPVVLIGGLSLTLLEINGGYFDKRIAAIIIGLYCLVPLTATLAIGLFTTFFVFPDEEIAGLMVYLLILSAIHLLAIAAVSAVVVRLRLIASTRMATLWGICLAMSLSLWFSGREYGAPLLSLPVILALCSLPCVYPFVLAPLGVYKIRHR